MKRKILTLVFVLCLIGIKAQEFKVKIEAEEIPNRLAFYAINENEVDLDVQLTIKGTNFRQSRGRPRYIRVPATSKVHMKTVVLMRGKKPSYTTEVIVRDSLSPRAVKKEFKLIKINPSRAITVYIPENCATCDSLQTSLETGKYLFSTFRLAEKPEMKSQLSRAFAGSINLDSLQTPIVNLGGKLFTRIEDYDQLLEALKQDQ